MDDPQVFQGLVENLESIVGAVAARVLIVVVSLALALAATYYIFHFLGRLLSPVWQARIWTWIPRLWVKSRLSEYWSRNSTTPWATIITVRVVAGLGFGILILWLIGFPLSWFPSVGIVALGVWAVATTPFRRLSNMRGLSGSPEPIGPAQEEQPLSPPLHVQIVVVQGGFLNSSLAQTMEGFGGKAFFEVDATFRPSMPLSVDGVFLDVDIGQPPAAYRATNPPAYLQTAETFHLVFNIPPALKTSGFVWSLRLLSSGIEWLSVGHQYEQ